ncbi:amidase [Sphingobium sp. SCG-1]|uniref:amidase n=1 Tax=Sphingobium sp. SCG-1 TaxID=2072936 RepID=UPI000CD69748|nr:amidase [Sphingobium sp. SCG-1]AUW60434.1 amidase [Sphingobium sp. SCG-1]
MRFCRVVPLLVALGFAASSPAMAKEDADALVEEVSAARLLDRLGAGEVTSEAIVRAYLDRIARIDRAGPELHSVLSINPDALTQARTLDAERRAGKIRGPLHGLPILVKDNIETKDKLPTTAGSLALRDNITGRDAPAIARLRAAGAVILGKTNLSEWANERDYNFISSWSGLGGLTKNPYVLNRSACGSSGGAGASLAASLAAVGIGTETDGSVTCPASMNGIVGLKPTIGLVSRTHVIPITRTQDTLGPMGRSVRDVALLFSAIIGSDPEDPVTKDADQYRRDYAAALSVDALRGVRIGVIRPGNMTRMVAERFDVALKRLQAAGADLVEVEMPKAEGMREAELKLFEYEFKTGINAYLATTPAPVRTRTLSDLIAFNKAHAERELGLFGQGVFESAEKLDSLESPAYFALRAKILALARDAGLDAMLRGYRVAALVAPSFPPPGIIDPVGGANGFGSYGTSNMPAIAGYPHLSVPMGLARGLPVGLSFIGPLFSDGDLLRYGFAFEATGPMREPPHYLSTVPVADLLRPYRP